MLITHILYNKMEYIKPNWICGWTMKPATHLETILQPFEQNTDLIVFSSPHPTLVSVPFNPLTTILCILALRPCSHLFRFAFRSRSGLVPVSFRSRSTRSCCVHTCKNWPDPFRLRACDAFTLVPERERNAYGYTHTPPQHIRFLILGLLSSRRVTALTASRHRRRRSRIDGQIRRCMMCRNFGLQRNFGRCIII